MQFSATYFTLPGSSLDQMIPAGFFLDVLHLMISSGVTM